MAIASGLCALGQGKAMAHACEALARNPGAREGIQFALIFGSGADRVPRAVYLCDYFYQSEVSVGCNEKASLVEAFLFACEIVVSSCARRSSCGLS